MFPPSGHVLVLDPDDAGMRLLDLLARAMPSVHPVDLRALLSGGEVRRNGEVCLHDCRLRPTDVVEVAREPASRPAIAAAVGAPLEVLFESDALLVVAKPAGLPTVPDRTGRERGVHGLLPALRPGADLRIVHRLDRDTSGCLILAKGLAAARHCDALFRDGGVRKTYVALVQGALTREEFTIDLWLGPDPRRAGRVVAAPRELAGYREAHTAVRRRAVHARYSLLELLPATGRSHQLRVHLQAIGHPIVADADYGGGPLLLSRLKPGYKGKKGVTERPLLARTFLHAEQVAFQDLDGTPVHVTAPWPEDLTMAYERVVAFDDPRRRTCD